MADRNCKNVQNAIPVLTAGEMILSTKVSFEEKKCYEEIYDIYFMISARPQPGGGRPKPKPRTQKPALPK